MRVLLLFVALWLSIGLAPAQTLPTGSANLPAPSPLATDSAAALQRLFASKRHVRPALMLSTALVGGVSLLAESVFGAGKIGSSESLTSQGGLVGLTVLAEAGELLYFRQYSPKKEQLALAALARHQLSPELMQLLKPRYFPASALAPANLPGPTPPPVAAPPAVDTAAALHLLFAQRRHSGHVGLRTGGGILAVSGIAFAIGAQSGGYNGLGVAVAGIIGGVISTPILIRSAVLTIAHSKGREQRVLQAWQQHRLPRRWARRALVPEYTQPQPKK